MCRYVKELGNIYSRLMNPTTHVLESRLAQLEGGHPLSGLAVASVRPLSHIALCTQLS
jgi:O-acetylhomoserine/O-acetylserine sulfhydrylase-like pyridoxal-dependent enzyme